MCLPIVISTHTRTNLMLTLFLLYHTHKKNSTFLYTAVCMYVRLLHVCCVRQKVKDKPVLLEFS